jgi:undecaprenyl-diphosphatase
VEEWLKTIFLGIVEGVTEFLPISSTAHLLIASAIVRFGESMGGTFEVAIQFGSVLAVLGFYAHDLLEQARDLPRSRHTRKFWLAILLAFIPAAVAGALLRDFIKRQLFTSPVVIAWALIVGGIVLIAVERVPRKPDTEQVTHVSWRQAIVVGFAQVAALVPGVSRSGATIVGGLVAGLSFYLAIPTLGAATLYDLARSVRDLNSGDIAYLVIGTLVAGIVAWLSIGWLLRYVAHHTFVPFGIYRVCAGLVVLALVALRMI